MQSKLAPTRAADPVAQVTHAAMQASRPSFVLIANTAECGDGESGWRFALWSVDASDPITASDVEPGADEDRLALLAVVRGLEALDQPSEVTVLTPRTAIARGFHRDLEGWRNNHWRWERFGRLTPIRNADLWRRVARALEFHRVQCRTWRSDDATVRDSGTAWRPTPRTDVAATGASLEAWSDSGRGRFDSPAMVIVRSPRSRRRVRLIEPLAAAG